MQGRWAGGQVRAASLGGGDEDWERRMERWTEMRKREDEWRGGRWAVRPDRDGEAGYPPPLRPVRKAVEEAVAAAIHRASLVRLLPSAFSWDVLAVGGIAADTSPVLPARSVGEHGASGSPGSGRNRLVFELVSHLALSHILSRVLIEEVYILYMCIFVAGRKQAKQTNNPSPIPQTTTKPNKHKNKK